MIHGLKMKQLTLLTSILVVNLLINQALARPKSPIEDSAVAELQDALDKIEREISSCKGPAAKGSLRSGRVGHKRFFWAALIPPLISLVVSAVKPKAREPEVPPRVVAVPVDRERNPPPPDAPRGPPPPPHPHPGAALKTAPSQVDDQEMIAIEDQLESMRRAEKAGREEAMRRLEEDRLREARQKAEDDALAQRQKNESYGDYYAPHQ